VKIQKECYDCLKGLIDQTVAFATEDVASSKLAKAAAVGILDREFSDSAIPAYIASKFHQVIRDLTGNFDPYLDMKREAMDRAKEIFRQVAPVYGDTLLSLLKLSVLGNALDFFREMEDVEADIKRGVDFYIDDGEKLKKLLEDSCGTILFLADNAGEQHFDLPLIRWLERRDFEVTYVVKNEPVQNDLTMEDLRWSGTLGCFRRVSKTEAPTVGLDLTMASQGLIETFDNARLIIAKGMGYYETLSHLANRGKILHLLMAKCRPVARSIGVPVNSYVAWLR
jgi:hypothetical protein